MSFTSEKRHHHPPNSPKGTIKFYAESFFSAANNLTFTVLAGDQSPTITGGYAKWQTIDRPLRRGLTVFQGYDPIIMQLPIRFIRLHGGMRTDRAAGIDIEADIEKLETMAGTGTFSGPSWRLWLTTFDGNGTTIPLIPFQYQSSSPGVPSPFANTVGVQVVPWIITGLTWDTSPIRNPDGYRIRQDATVTVQLYGSVNSDQAAGLARSRALTVISKPGADSALKIARGSVTTNVTTLARTIIHAEQNERLKLRSVNSPIKHGKRVYIPTGN